MRGKTDMKSMDEKNTLQGFIKEFRIYWESHQMRSEEKNRDSSL